MIYYRIYGKNREDILMKCFFNKKIIVYISAVLMLASCPVSVHAAENTQPAGAQTDNTQTDNTPANNTPTDNTQTENAPAQNTPGLTTPGLTTPADGTNASTVTDIPASGSQAEETLPAQNPSDITVTPLPEPAPLPGTPPADSSVDVTPLQTTVYAATSSGLNVRSGPSTGHGKIGTLKYGQTITVTGKTADNWYQIQYSGGVGYVLADYVSTTPLAVETPAAPNPDTGNDAAAPDPGEADAPIADEDTPDPGEAAGGQDSEDNSEATEEDTEEDTETKTTRLFGTPVIVILVLAIVGVLALISYSVFSLFKKDGSSGGDYEAGDYEDDYYEDEYYNDPSSPENGEYYEDTFYEEDDDDRFE